MSSKRLPKTIRDNLSFLLVEVSSQLKYLHTYFEHQSPTLAQRIKDRSGYAYNLNQRIQSACLTVSSHHAGQNGLVTRTVAAVAADLEKLTELTRDCVQQLGRLGSEHSLTLSLYFPLIERVLKGVDLIGDALLKNDTPLALKIGRIERKLSKAHKSLLVRYTEQLRGKSSPDDLIIGLFIAQIFERMGSVLLTISESIISNNIGQPMDMQRFRSLQNTLSTWADKDYLDDIAVKSIAETRSGSGISSVNYKDSQNNEHFAIYKDGEKRKLREEADGVERWHQIYPGVAPQILTYKKNGDSASLLIEHLQGETFEHIVLQAPLNEMSDAMRALGKTLHAVWTKTRSSTVVPAHYIRQTRKRLSDVYAIHPEFREVTHKVCDLELPSFEELLARAQTLEERIEVPFSVFIHGDFNVDNIIYNAVAKKINYIDLHRSTHMDYVQDVSVFMVSNYRLQVLEPSVRRRIRKQIYDFYKIARKFAESQKDHTFELRLTLGLARSFVTSTRFILDKSMAKRMFLRAHYLLAHLEKADLEKPESYRLSIKEIFSD